LLSGDPTWRDLTALVVHYETQPLPTWIGWYAHQLPLWIQKASCLVMFIIELAIPFLFFAPRRLRILGAAVTTFLQVVILLTGNYTFFNWLALALCLTLLDDFALERYTPGRLRTLFTRHASLTTTLHSERTPSPLPSPPMGERVSAGRVRGTGAAQWLRVSWWSWQICRPDSWRRFVIIPLAFIVISTSSLQLISMFGVRSSLFKPVAALHEWLAPFRSLNSYGLFAVMTTTRPEIIVEGSNDGINWLPYEFEYKPGDVKRRPAFVAPHQPRLDWQMWFAALDTWRRNPWLLNLATRLLRGSPEVLALLEKNPFPDKPPRFIRATLYDYRFTDFAGRKQTGAWWTRKPTGEYLPPISLEKGGR
jgi:hypothetical protein